MTASRPADRPTARGVLDALARVCREEGVLYGDDGSNLWVEVSTDLAVDGTPDGETAVVSVAVGGDTPDILAAFTITLTPVVVPRPATATDGPHELCPAAAAYPHPRHFWRGAETGGWETVPTPTPDSSWCSGGAT